MSFLVDFSMQEPMCDTWPHRTPKYIVLAKSITSFQVSCKHFLSVNRNLLRSQLLFVGVLHLWKTYQDPSCPQMVPQALWSWATAKASLPGPNSSSKPACPLTYILINYCYASITVVLYVDKNVLWGVRIHMQRQKTVIVNILLATLSFNFQQVFFLNSLSYCTKPLPFLLP